MGSKLEEIKDALAKYVAGEAEPSKLRSLPGMSESVWECDDWVAITKPSFREQKTLLRIPFDMPDEAPPLMTIEVWHTLTALHRRVPFDGIEYTHDKKDIANWAWRHCAKAVKASKA